MKRSLLGALLLLLTPGLVLAQSKVDRSDTAAFGSPAFYPSPEHPIGWRADGSGRYPAADPPMAWERKKAGAGYATKNVVWMTPMADWGVSCPILVGDRIFLTTEISDLVCLEKKTGKVLWIHSNPEFEGLDEEDKKELESVMPKLRSLHAEQEKINTELVRVLNTGIAAAPKAATLNVAAATKRKKEIEKEIDTLQKGANKKKFDRYWGQAVFGFSGGTPTSDGKHVCAFFTTGTSVCYDLDGKRKWIQHGRGGGSEHGNFASPVLVDGKLAVWANEMRGYDVETGKLAWSHVAKGSNTYGSMFRFKSGGDMVAAFQCGFFVRAKDGQMLWGAPNAGLFGDAVCTPIVEGDTIYAWLGYPRINDKAFKSWKIPDSTEGTKLAPDRTYKIEWGENEVPVDKKKGPFNRGYVSSPLYVDGLIYQMTQGCGLIVHDAATGEIVYRKVLPLKPRTEYWNWAGASTSPTLAGKHIYLMDNQGGTVIIEPGREYKEVAKNYLEESKDGKEQVQMVSTPVFEGTRMYFRSPGYLYCIGAK